MEEASLHTTRIKQLFISTQYYDKHGVPPTKRLFKVAMLDPSLEFIGSWGMCGDLGLPIVGHRDASENFFVSPTLKVSDWSSGLKGLRVGLLSQLQLNRSGNVEARQLRYEWAPPQVTQLAQCFYGAGVELEMLLVEK
ncbi:hypothetical protein Tco_1283171 [Tanacetum coccineum]